MSKKLLFLLLLIASGILVYTLRLSGANYIKIAGVTQGTSYHITFKDLGQGDLQKQIDSVLHQFDLSLSSWEKNSLISRINRNETDSLDPFFYTVLKESKRIYDLSDHYFDITVAPLVDAWGFGSGASSDLDSAGVDSILQFTGFDKISFTKHKITKSDPRIQITVDAIAQGYSCDVVAHFLESRGIKDYMVEIGGEVRARGKNPDRNYWRIGIDRPIENNPVAGMDLEAIVELENMSLATSGNYRKFYVKNGVKYTHTVNPITGYTVSQNLLSATILSPEGITADGFATACMARGLEASKQMIEDNKDLEGFLIYSDENGNFKTWTSKGFEPYLLEVSKN